MNPQLASVEYSPLLEDPIPGCWRKQEKVIIRMACQGREKRETEEGEKKSKKIHYRPCFSLGGIFST